jgi:predicted amidohydrolase
VLARATIAAAVAEGVQVVVLPELASSGYVFQSVEEARAAAVPADGALLAGWAEEAARGDALVVGGFCELADDGRLFNSAVLLDGDGVIAVYRKIHLWDEEPGWFVPGEAPAPVVQTRHGRIGLAVCYDLEFPELTRGLALEGAELIAVPTNWPRDEAAPNGQPVLLTLAVTTAYCNKVFVAVADRCGAERGVDFAGASVIAGPDGARLAGPVEGGGVATLHVDCDLRAAREKRTGARNDAFADRRPDRYSGILLGR